MVLSLQLMIELRSPRGTTTLSSSGLDEGFLGGKVRKGEGFLGGKGFCWRVWSRSSNLPSLSSSSLPERPELDSSSEATCRPYPSDLVAIFEGQPACAVQNSAVSVHVLLQREVEFFFKAQHLGLPSVLFNLTDRAGYGAWRFALDPLAGIMFLGFYPNTAGALKTKEISV